jgi:hypothetical protein
MKKVQTHKPGKFMIVCGEKIYKFACKDDEEKDLWIKALENEIKKNKSETIKKLENLHEVKLKKKVIEDFYNLPNIHSEKLKTKSKIDQVIKSEGYFKEKSKSYLISNKNRKPTTQVNKKLLENQQNYEEITRSKNETFTTERSQISALNIGLIDKKPKNNKSIFSCCNKIVMLFKQKKTENDYDI